jgi:hypothetical protein
MEAEYWLKGLEKKLMIA